MIFEAYSVMKIFKLYLLETAVKEIFACVIHTTMNENVEDAPAATSLQMLFLEES